MRVVSVAAPGRFGRAENTLSRDSGKGVYVCLYGAFVILDGHVAMPVAKATQLFGVGDGTVMTTVDVIRKSRGLCTYTGFKVFVVQNWSSVTCHKVFQASDVVESSYREREIFEHIAATPAVSRWAREPSALSALVFYSIPNKCYAYKEGNSVTGTLNFVSGFHSACFFFFLTGL